MAKSKGKRKGGKGKKGRKKGKKKKKKDLTGDRTMESLFEELVRHKIIHKYPKIRMSEMIAQCSFVNYELRSYHAEHPFETKTEEFYIPGDANPHPAFGDVLRAVKDVCILPLGSPEVHSMTPAAPKSVLICGPEGSGKHTIVNMICTELKATLIDLTATTLAGKYPGKAGMKMLLHLIQKVGRACQPVILFVDNCEKMFAKKVPKTDKTEPKRLKKKMKKLFKGLKPEDCFLLVGVTHEPWACSFKSLKKTYQRIIYVPPADYGTRFEMWKKVLTKNLDMLHPDIHYSLLAKLSHGWTTGFIRTVCLSLIQKHQKDVTKQEKEKQKEMDPWGHLGNVVVRPVTIGKLSITMDKILESLAEFDPVFLEQEKLWNKWFKKTPLQKARLATQAKVGGKKKKKGKKGKKKGKR